jgi:hypothetical protein
MDRDVLGRPAPRSGGYRAYWVAGSWEGNKLLICGGGDGRVDASLKLCRCTWEINSIARSASEVPSLVVNERSRGGSLARDCLSRPSAFHLLSSLSQTQTQPFFVSEDMRRTRRQIDKKGQVPFKQVPGRKKSLEKSPSRMGVIYSGG